jgi:hypothetical protein
MAEKEKESGKTKKPLPLSVKFALFSVMVAAVVFHPTSIVFAACMLPTLVAAVVDRETEKTMWITVGAMNLAGTIPAGFALWTTGHNLDNVFVVLSDPVLLFIAMGGAATGWFLYQNVTPFVASAMMRRSHKRLKDIDKRQKDLVKKWGAEVGKA